MLEKVKVKVQCGGMRSDWLREILRIGCCGGGILCFILGEVSNSIEQSSCGYIAICE